MINEDSQQKSDIKPDIIIPYDANKLQDSSIAVIYVRPETNKIDYEAIIIRAIYNYVDVIYMANLNGKLLSQKATIASHYASQIQFASHGKAELANYPQMMNAFEEKFGVDFSEANIIGAYEAIIQDKKDISDGIDELFDILVSEEDFLELYGQTIKKIGRYYLINYDIPAIMSKYDIHANILALAVKFKKSIPFADLNYIIYNEFCKQKSIDLLDYAKRKNMQWYDQVRRTYHISKSHIQAMFDSTDFIFDKNGQTVGFSDTPLGRNLIEKGILSKEESEYKLNKLKENPLVYVWQEKQTRKLVNIIEEGKSKKSIGLAEKNLAECCELFRAIEW